MRQVDNTSIQARASQVLDAIDGILAGEGEASPAEDETQSEITTLKGAIAGLDGKIAILGAEVAQAKQVSSDITALKGMVANLQAQVGKLSQGKDPLYRPPEGKQGD